MPAEQTTCPCSSGRTYAACCKPMHDGIAAPHAEALMRSRYSAYVLRLRIYLLETWQSDTRPAILELAADDMTRWLGLEVKRREQISAHEARVEFVARYGIGGASAQRLHEISRFVQENGRWYYVDGTFPDD